MRNTLILCLLVVCFGFVSAAQAQKTVKVDGSSTVFPISEAMAEEFQKENRDIRVTVGISGTGGGFKKFLRGEIDIADASRPILEKELAEARSAGIEFIELPVAFDALTVMVNPKNDWVDQLTVAELKTIWQPDAAGKITTWKQVRATFPDSWNLRLRDHRGAHTAQRILGPENVRCVWLPPDGPELNPIERVGRDLKDDLAWQPCANVEAPQADGGQL